MQFTLHLCVMGDYTERILIVHWGISLTGRETEATEACVNRDCEDKGCEGGGSSILNADTIHFFPRLALFPPSLFRKHTKAGLMARVYAASRARCRLVAQTFLLQTLLVSRMYAVIN